ncbi:MAG: ATP-dependent helicase [bacterium]|nr:ATP-dependent helicase [bacterium]
MIINAISDKYREELLSERVAELILSGVKTDEILVLTLNSFKKEQISALIYDRIFSNDKKGFASLNISTFAGIVYNSILKNWADIENLLVRGDGESEVYPTLCGLDAAQYFLQKIIQEEDFEDYFSKKNLMHQLLRRYKLIVENVLSDSEVVQKSNILNETFAASALKAIKSYKLVSSKNRFFDNLKQTASFLYFLKQGKIKDFDKIKYFIADDADEYSFAAFEFCKYMTKTAKESYFYLDRDGCTREGYLCGYTGVYDDLIKLGQKEININSNHNMLKDAQVLQRNMVNQEHNELVNFEAASYSKRLEMIEAATVRIEKLLSDGIPIYKIHIVTPLADENLIYSLKEFFNQRKIKVQLLTGNKKIVDDIYVYAIITIFELLNPHWGLKPNGFDIRILLNEILKIPVYELQDWISYYEKKGELSSEKSEKYENYNSLIDLLNDEELKNASLIEQYERIFAEIIAPNMHENSDFNPINLFMKSLNEFEKIRANYQKYDGIELTPVDWLLHIKNSIVSQNPSKPAHIDKNALVVSTAQKIVDFSLNSDYQIWLDTSSSEWIKEDTGTIYNSWVFQKNYKELDFSQEMNKKRTVEKTAKLLRKLIMCTNKKVIALSSVFDASGRENFGELANYIEIAEENKKEFDFTPRDDQKEILDYSGGKMAVPAVPGAGKTTVMLALLAALVDRCVSPNNILVLTYMESAARNFLNRYKKISKNKNSLPQISTIHAFAFKILMENNNYAKVNLSEDFSICDDGIKTSIVKDICARNLPVGEDLDDYSALMLSAISKTKINRVNNKAIKDFANSDLQIKEFSQIYYAYKNRLKELALLDYDDLLVYAVELLHDNSDIAEYYRKQFKYIIEDEAQDSSSIQQELIGILASEKSNLIRCGDVNQAILGTFSNSDVKGFKKFISENRKVEMFRSQRCSKNIYTLANELVDKALHSSVTKDAFYDLKMEEVEGKNPKSTQPVEYKILDKPIDEKEFVINDIKSKLTDRDNLPTIAILLRKNRQVASWAAFIEKQGLKVMCRGDSYKQKKVFTFILSAMELFIQPWNNKIAAKFYKEICDIGKFKYDEELYNFIEKNPNKFLQPDFLKNTHFPNKDLENFWWEAFFVTESQTLDIQKIITFCANRYFDDVIDKSNAYLFAILVKRYTNTLIADEKFQLNYIPEVLKYFKNLLSQRTLKGINFFAKEDEDEELNGFVQIMTVHKAKGAEFDYVYMPEFTDYNYALGFSDICTKIQNRKKPLLSKLDKLIEGKEKIVSEAAKEELHETLRLIYVAITRAKLGLTFSYSSKNDFKKDNEPVQFLEELLASRLTAK